MRSNKSQSLANFLLVFLTLVIVTTSLFYISIKENNYGKNFNSPYALDSVYSREGIINFYLQDILDHSAVSIKDKQDLINNINSIALKYEKNDENVAIVLRSIENLKEEDIELVENNGKIESANAFTASTTEINSLGE
ncbi:hypothetical protein J4205_00145 [Candidatus Pacearchaeota archaeon]|nr:hypothetical protein [Candidatus Pacearchaeota archaeon]